VRLEYAPMRWLYNHKQASHSLLTKKNLELFRTPMRNFPGPFRSPRMFKYNVYWHHKLKSRELQVICERSQQKKMISIRVYEKMRDFKGRFSRTFQVLEFSRKKSRTFQEAWEPCINHGYSMIHSKGLVTHCPLQGSVNRFIQVLF